MSNKKRTVRSKRIPRVRSASSRTLKYLKGLSYSDLKNLSSDQLRKYLRLCGRTEPEWGGGYTDKDIIRILRRYISKKETKKTKRGGCGKGGGKKTVRKSKAKSGESAYFEFKKGSSRKFWRIVKKGTQIITQYGRFGSLGQMTTKDYHSNVDQEYDKLIKSKKKKGYVEKTDYGDPNPKKPTKIEKEYLKICKKAEKSKVLNPNQVNSDCEAMLDQGESELKWMTQWHKDALKKGEYDWDKYTEHNKKGRKK